MSYFDSILTQITRWIRSFFEKYCLQRSYQYHHDTKHKNIIAKKNLKDHKRRIAVSKKRSNFRLNPESVNRIPRSLARHPIIYSARENPRPRIVDDSSGPSNFPAINLLRDPLSKQVGSPSPPQLHFPTPVPLALSRNQPRRPTRNSTTHLAA